MLTDDEIDALIAAATDWPIIVGPSDARAIFRAGMREAAKIASATGDRLASTPHTGIGQVTGAKAAARAIRAAAGEESSAHQEPKP